MLWSIWFYRAVFALACAAGVVLLALNAPGIGLLVILCGGGVVVLGAFANAYREHGARGVVGVTLAGLADFFADFIGFSKGEVRPGRSGARGDGDGAGGRAERAHLRPANRELSSSAGLRCAW